MKKIILEFARRGFISGIFLLGYFIIWVVICSITQKRTKRINEILKKKQQNAKKECC